MVWIHPFSEYAKFSKKNWQLLPPDKHTYVCVSEGAKSKFFKNFRTCWMNDSLRAIKLTEEHCLTFFGVYAWCDTRLQHHHHTLRRPVLAHKVITSFYQRPIKQALHHTNIWLVSCYYKYVILNTSFVVCLQSCLRVKRRIAAYIISHLGQKTNCKVAHCSKSFL